MAMMVYEILPPSDRQLLTLLFCLPIHHCCLLHHAAAAFYESLVSGRVRALQCALCIPSNVVFAIVATNTIRQSTNLNSHPVFFCRYAPTRSDPSVRATSVAFSPFHPQLFLVGLSTGDLALYHVDHAEAAMEWALVDTDQSKNHGRAVLNICWSTVRACVFFVLTGDALRTQTGAMPSDDQPLQSSLQVHSHTNVPRNILIVTDNVPIKLTGLCCCRCGICPKMLRNQLYDMICPPSLEHQLETLQYRNTRVNLQVAIHTQPLLMTVAFYT